MTAADEYEIGEREGLADARRGRSFAGDDRPRTPYDRGYLAGWREGKRERGEAS